jgi:hypothetical protein
MFNESYWRDKRERLERSKPVFSLGAINFLKGVFHREDRMVDSASGSVHTRSPKERRIRRARHRSMMRNAL